MRKYFVFDGRGGRSFLQMFAAWFVAAVACAVAFLLRRYLYEPDPEFGGRFFLWVGGNMLAAVLALAAGAMALYWMAGTLLGGVSIGGERPVADLNGREYASLCVRGVLLTAVTCGVWAPWFAVRLMRYFASHTSFRRENFRFRGRGSTLFAFCAVLCVAPLYIVMAFMPLVVLAVITDSVGILVGAAAGCVAVIFLISMFRALAFRWTVDLGWRFSRAAVSVEPFRAAAFLTGQTLLTIVTCGLWWPMALLLGWRYFAVRTVFGEAAVEGRLGFAFRGWPEYLSLLGQALLTVLTLGLYLPWAWTRVCRLIVGHTYVDTVDKPSEPLPTDYV